MAYLYRGPQSPRDETQFSNYSSNPLSPPRKSNRLSGGMTGGGGDVRGGLTRRFTTNALPTLTPIGQQRMQAAGDPQMIPGYGRLPPSERKIRHIEGLLEQQRRINAELEQVDDETRREIEEGLRHERAVTQLMAQSEPTTPPEYQDTFASIARPNRYSISSLTSPLGGSSRPSRSSTHLTSPSTSLIRPYTANNPTLPSQSVPVSRRQSDDEEDDEDFLFYDPTVHRAAAHPNRNSMPVTSYDRKRNATELSSALGPLNTTSFLFDEDDNQSAPSAKTANRPSPPDTKTYLQVQHTADGFPKLIRRGDKADFISGSSAALDLALSQSVSTEQQVPDRVSGTRHRISLPPSALSNIGTIAPLNSILANSNDVKSAANNRRSVEVKFTAETKRPSLMASPPRVTNGAPKPLSSYSTNDIPTLKSISDDSPGGVPVNTPSTLPSNHTDTPSPEDSSNLIRVSSGPTSVTVNRKSQDYITPANSPEHNGIFGQPQSGLQGGAIPFGPINSPDGTHIPPFTAPNMPYGQPAFYGGYGMQMLNNSFSNVSLNGGYSMQGQWANQMPTYQQAGYTGYQQFSQNGPVGAGTSAGASAVRFSDTSRAAIQQRKAQADELFNSVKISELVGQIYGLCKDQHGCRFLQKKLEERNEEEIQVIFEDVKEHFIELMTDPFGNYLCQKLLEYANDAQRTALVQNAVPALTKIALNQHGTRALQRMIEFISTPEQINSIIDALRYDVVQLIQDLNGNHVIQKCLNHLSSKDAQFIFDAVGANCITVGTHRHGCCVLQRCVDHASGLQKGGLVDHIIDNAFALVQDPFGNYVVQYILDLSEPCFTEPLCRSFLGNIVFLSKQKFSSNVIEKCIRCAEKDTKRMFIQEILPTQELEKLLRDSFANYVVQTAMDYADEVTKIELVDNLRPILPTIRHTPYGRRIQSKIQDYEGGNVSLSTGLSQTSVTSSVVTPIDSTNPQTPYSGRGNRMGMIGAPPQWGGNTSFNNITGFAGINGGDIQQPTQQSIPAYNTLNGAQGYPLHNFSASQLNSMGRQAPTFGHF